MARLAESREVADAHEDGRMSQREVWPGRRHVLDLDDFTSEEITQVLDCAESMAEILARPISKVPTLRGTTVVNLFFEPSTRTRVSFELAAKNLGADVVNISASGSSVEKGESLIDTLRTLRSLGADIMVMRHSQSGAPYVAARHTDASVINAGDGCHAHPTQALLDLYTLRRRLGRLAGTKVAIVGDVLHSRVARSNLWGLLKMGAQVALCGPPTLMPLPEEVTTVWGGFGRLGIYYEVESALEGADAVMALRLQKERQDQGLLPSLREYVARYCLTPERVALAEPGALIMHPGPMNQSVEIDPRVAYGCQSVVEEQVSNGVAVRMALLYLLTPSHGDAGR